MRTSQLPPGVRLQYLKAKLFAKAEFFKFLIILTGFNFLFYTQKWQKTPSFLPAVF